MINKSLSQQVTEMRGQCWHEWVLNNKPCIYCHIGITDISERPDYEHDANKYMMLFQELPVETQIRKTHDTIQILCPTDGKTFNFYQDKEIGKTICEAWKECFKCKECIDGFIFDESGSGICNVPCPNCNGTGSTFKKEGG